MIFTTRDCIIIHLNRTTALAPLLHLTAHVATRMSVMAQFGQFYYSNRQLCSGGLTTVLKSIMLKISRQVGNYEHSTYWQSSISEWSKFRQGRSKLLMHLSCVSRNSMMQLNCCHVVMQKMKLCCQLWYLEWDVTNDIIKSSQ